MADPLSIVTGCVGLVATIGTMAVRITSFVRTVREARGDLDSISRELASLQTILDLIQADASNILPETLIRHLEGIIENCNAVMKDLERVLDKYQHGGRGASGKWAIYGKQDVEGLQARVETNTRSLNLAVDYMSLVTTIENKELATRIKEDTTEIKQDTAKILEEIACLRALLPPEVDAANGYMLDRYLEQISTFTELALDCVESDDETELCETIALPAPISPMPSSTPPAPEPHAVGPREAASPGEHSTGHTAEKSVALVGWPLPGRNSNLPRFLLGSPAKSVLDAQAQAHPYYGNCVLRVDVGRHITTMARRKDFATEGFSQARYSAVTCGPRGFRSCNYVLRQDTRTPPRRTALLFSVYLHDPATVPCFETLRKVWSGFDYLHRAAPPLHIGQQASTPFGKDGWKYAVLHLHLKEPPRPAFAKALEALGIRPSIAEGGGPSGHSEYYEAGEYHGRKTRWHMWEYTSELRITQWDIPQSKFDCSRGDYPIQTIVTYPGAKKLFQMPNFHQWVHWRDAIADSLQAEQTVAGESSEVRALFEPKMLGNAWMHRDLLPHGLSISELKDYIPI